MDSTRADMTQAVLEGVAFAIKDCVEIARAQGVEIASSTLCGGGAKSPLWREIMAIFWAFPWRCPRLSRAPVTAAPCWQPLPAANTPRCRNARIS